MPERTAESNCHALFRMETGRGRGWAEKTALVLVAKGEMAGWGRPVVQPAQHHSGKNWGLVVGVPDDRQGKEVTRRRGARGKRGKREFVAEAHRSQRGREGRQERQIG